MLKKEGLIMMKKVKSLAKNTFKVLVIATLLTGVSTYLALDSEVWADEVWPVNGSYGNELQQ